MRGRLCVVILAAIAVLAAGCGTRQASADALSAAVANTAATTSRVAVSTTMSSPGMTTTITAAGEFDYAHPRGVLRMGGLAPGGQEVRYLPPRLYVKFAEAPGAPSPRGKAWVEISVPGQAADGSLPFLPLGNVSANPMDLLSALTAIASKVTDFLAAARRDLDQAAAAGREVTAAPGKDAAEITDSLRAWSASWIGMPPTSSPLSGPCPTGAGKPQAGGRGRPFRHTTR